MKIKASTILQTKFGNLTLNYHTQGKIFCLSIVHGDISKENVIVRLHSSCIFSESFETIDCDCSIQLSKSLELISKTNGVIIYLFQEGRGVGLLNKIKAVEQERIQNIDTVEAFNFLHFPLDGRDYTIAIKALDELKISKKIRLITNNPNKRIQLRNGNYIIQENIKLKYPVNEIMKKYLHVKKTKLGHDV